ncbi:MAG: PSA repeat domain-containing protein [Candidatus Peribacteraceae bacterium]|nr:PSA repeat domain-containing protein [Candidatus Peribacteraceae bacterium]MDD5075310.1 PSA repeat domain-containing protein [Candidatus Peribacteraceae bacterium]
MRRSIVSVSAGLSVFLLAFFFVAMTDGNVLLAFIPGTFQNPLTRTFRRRSTRVIVSKTPCTQRTKESQCAEGVAGGTCYWDAHGNKCVVTKPGCIDDDGGLNFYRASVTYGLENAADTAANAHADYCETVRTGSGKVVTEYYCTADGFVAYQAFRCPIWCEKGACQVPKKPEGDDGTLPPLTQRVLELSPGSFPYGSIDASSYESEIALTPRYSFLLQRVTPSVSACSGQCTYEVTVSDSARRVLTKLTGKIRDGTDLSAAADLPIRLDINKRYYFLQRMTSDKSVTFGTTGAIVDIPRAKIEVITSQSGNTDYKKWGTPVFAVDGLFVK